MTNQINVLTVRVNGELKAYKGINDSYTVIQLNVYKDWLSEAEIQYLRDARLYECDIYFYYEQAAEDFTGTFGNLKISIETVEIKFS